VKTFLKFLLQIYIERGRKEGWEGREGKEGGKGRKKGKREGGRKD
jgi:hypothetical protein